MMDGAPNLSRYSFKDLVDLKAEVERELEAKRVEARERLLGEMKARAEEEGLSLDEVVGSRGNGRARRPTVKYRNPLDPSQTWSGRGRRPGWLEAALKDGTSLESLRV